VSARKAVKKTGRSRLAASPDGAEPARRRSRCALLSCCQSRHPAGARGNCEATAISAPARLPDAAVRITLEIAAELPAGAPEKLVRIVTENGRTLKVDGGFEG
jgi:hypothetical protein